MICSAQLLILYAVTACLLASILPVSSSNRDKKGNSSKSSSIKKSLTKTFGKKATTKDHGAGASTAKPDRTTAEAKHDRMVAEASAPKKPIKEHITYNMMPEHTTGGPLETVQVVCSHSSIGRDYKGAARHEDKYYEADQRVLTDLYDTKTFGEANAIRHNVEHQGRMNYFHARQR